MAYAAWTNTTAYTVGNVRRATTLQSSGLVFQCTVAGTSAATEPSWPTDISSTVVDGSVTWVAISAVYEDLSVLAPSAIVELFELQLDSTLHGSTDTYRWHDGCKADVTGNVVFGGNSYIRLPIKAEGFEFTSAGGTLPRPTLTIANLEGTITTLLLLVNATTPGNDLTGATVRRIRTLKKYLDSEPTADSHARFPTEIWYIDRKAAENRDTVSFELASKFDMAGIMLPRRQLIANICQWKYKSTECSWSPKANFTGTYNLRVLTATYTRSGTTITVTSTSHGFVAGDRAYFDFTSGAGTDNFYVVQTAATNTFTITSEASGTISTSNVSVYLLKVSATAHGYAVNDTVHLDFTSGTATDGRYLIGAVTTNNFCVEIKSGTATSGNVNGTQYYDLADAAVFTSGADVCGKRLSSCAYRFGTTAELPYGSFPSAGLTT